MGLDIRLPIGLLFGITGLIMVVYGAVTNGSSIYAVSEGVNLNLLWGGCMLVFGIIMTVLGRKRS